MELTILRQTFLSGICLLAIFTVLSNGQNSDFVCEALRPVDFVTAPQPSDSSPYMLLIQTTEYIIGNDLSVMVAVNIERSFTELFLAARDVATRGFVGMWNFRAGDSQRSTIDCFDGPTVFNYTPSLPQRTNFQASWTLPSQSFRPIQGIEFQATIVDSSGLFWSPVTSQTVNVLLPDSPNNLPSLQCPPDEQFEGARIFRTPSCINTESPTDVRVFCGVQNGTILTTTTTITCVCVYQDDVVDECSYTLTLSNNISPTLQCMDEVFQGSRFFQPPECTDPGSPADVIVACNVTTGTAITTTTTISCTCTYQSRAVDTCLFTLTNPCQPSPCVNGDCFRLDATGFFCICSAGYTGQICDTLDTPTDSPPMITCPSNAIQVEQDGGASLFWVPITCMDQEDGDIDLQQISCDASLGQFFPAGDYVIQCSCMDSNNNIDTCEIRGTIDAAPNNPPVLTCMNVNTQVNSFQPPSCTNVETSTNDLNVTCNFQENQALLVGVNMVMCTCTDESGAMDSCIYTITVEGINNPPFLLCRDVNTQDNSFQLPICADMETSLDDLNFTCNFQVNQPLSVGVNNVTCMCTDGSGAMSSCSYTITVQAPPNNPPELICMDINTQDNSFEPPTCTDIETSTNDLNVDCNFQENEVLSVGVSNVTCTCTDVSGTNDSCSYTIIVQAAPNNPPELTCTNVNTQDNSFQPPSCTDVETSTNDLDVDCTFEENEDLSVGVNMVTCTCTDGSGAMSSCTYNITVQEPEATSPGSDPTSPRQAARNNPPVLNCANVNTQDNSFQPPSCTDVETSTNDLDVDCNLQENQALSVGVNNVTCTCTDSSGTNNSCSYTITLQESETTLPGSGTTTPSQGTCEIPTLENAEVICEDSRQLNCRFSCRAGTVSAITQYGPLDCRREDSLWEPRPLNGLCQAPREPVGVSTTFFVPVTTNLTTCTTNDVMLHQGIIDFFQKLLTERLNDFCRQRTTRELSGCVGGTTMEMRGRCAVRNFATAMTRRKRQTEGERIFSLTMNVMSDLNFSSFTDFSANFSNTLMSIMVPKPINVTNAPYTVTFTERDQQDVSRSNVNYVCDSGHTYVGDGNCVRCPAGTFMNSDGRCQLCAIGEYQSLLSQVRCTRCPNSGITARPGAVSDEECESPLVTSSPEQGNLFEEPIVIAGIALAGILAVCIVFLLGVTLYVCCCQQDFDEASRVKPSDTRPLREQSEMYQIRDNNGQTIRRHDNSEVATVAYTSKPDDEISDGEDPRSYDNPVASIPMRIEDDSDISDPSDAGSIGPRPTTVL